MRANLVFLFLILSVAASGQQKLRNVKTEIALLKTSLAKHHVQPRAIDDAFSSDMFDKLIEELDPDKIFFTQGDITALHPFRTKLDDEVNGKASGFLSLVKEKYRAGLKRSEMLVNTIMDSPADWQTSELYDPESERAGSETELLDRHRQWLKYQVLDRMTEIRQRDSSSRADFFKDNITNAIAHVKLTALRPVRRLLADPVLYENEMSDAFLQTMASVFDPHSAFFSLAQYDDFVGALSSQDYYFGFVLGEDGKGNVIVSALAPGGPAWKSGALHVSDILVAVKWQNEDAIRVAGLNTEDVEEIFSDNPSDQVEMTVRSADGHEKTVLLRKEKLESEQNIVQSFILEGPVRAGYIYLPDFYTRWDDEQEGGRCANDVAKEIIRLKKEGIDGIILDLRFNGGGSLFEARAMAGIFIDEGPLAMVTTRDKQAVSLKDMNRGTVYDGPLILMVNGQSASASEVLAAAIQDYNRGLIVGGRTYGKATGQNLFPIEGGPASVSQPKNSAGYVKLTTQRLYRVTGKSAQGRGVIPDVPLPDAFNSLEIRESDIPFALQQDSVLVNPYYKPLLPLKRKALQELSAARIAANPAFIELGETIAWLANEMEKKFVAHTLGWESFLAMSKEQQLRQKKLGSIKSAEKAFEVRFGESKEDRLVVDEYANDLYGKWIETLASDIYLQETYQVLRDHISLNKNPE